ncbi:hypothetical protein MB901379_02970 [Mycobacterium basiliense]|uniref:Uncharacterized protein n=1 Tax=Mycobacterium basiliense TaxID=2094119 RepID=A0A3S4FRX5_9MYCO|nr:hypothetical protein [Mycobacterium basiliense]VDM89394.1 hypothetical protein MB901379_02970 [Mycobacterium basiliense]
MKPGIGNDECQGDEWPAILEKIKRCNVIVPAMPIWIALMMEMRSVDCQQLLTNG